MTRALVVEDIDHHHDTPGAIEIRSYPDGSVGGIAFICPCGCKREGYLPVKPDDPGPRWDWNGDRERPTLTPSVLFRGGCEWHGFLTAGEWRQC
ncbi:hypothetical protein EJ082_01340 [Brevundimonas diminuta]|uniref:DUF6527 family protein n=1 Tax=Brevundimonas diminuta TaxID=293 RepID=UPI00168A8E2D|nr:DUF6527 family protein [Brevundimonas diminuta]MBD3571621.1 hypothetical protein [Brevundimonas diminuta]